MEDAISAKGVKTCSVSRFSSGELASDEAASVETVSDEAASEEVTSAEAASPEATSVCETVSAVSVCAIGSGS